LFVIKGKNTKSAVVGEASRNSTKKTNKGGGGEGRNWEPDNNREWVGGGKSRKQFEGFHDPILGLK